MKRLLLSLFVLFYMILSSPVYAMIFEVPLTDLVNSSDLIVRAVIEEVKPMGKNSDGLPMFANKAVINAVFKGNENINKSEGNFIVIKTYENLEDSPSFEKGALAMLFLKKLSNHYVINQGLQGAWLVRDGAYTGFGRQYKTQDVIDCVNGNYKKPEDKIKILMEKLLQLEKDKKDSKK